MGSEDLPGTWPPALLRCCGPPSITSCPQSAHTMWFVPSAARKRKRGSPGWASSTCALTSPLKDAPQSLHVPGKDASDLREQDASDDRADARGGLGPIRTSRHVLDVDAGVVVEDLLRDL